MADGHRRRYRIRRALAGSFLAAAATASLSGLGASAASAAPLVSAASHQVLPASGVGRGATASCTASARERLDGVRAELDQAILFRLVTPEQAELFYAQIERRVAAGL